MLKSLDQIIEQAGSVLSVKNTLFTINNDSLVITASQDHKNELDYLASTFISSWGFLNDIPVDISIERTSAYTSNVFSFEIVKGDNLYGYKLLTKNHSEQNIKVNFLKVLPFFSRIVSDHTLRNVINFYQKEVMTQGLTMVGIHKCVEEIAIFLDKKNGRAKLAMLAKKDPKYVNDLMETIQLQRHGPQYTAHRGIKKILSETECINRCKFLINVYYKSVNSSSNEYKLIKRKNRTEEIIESYYSLDKNTQLVLLLMLSFGEYSSLRYIKELYSSVSHGRCLENEVFLRLEREFINVIDDEYVCFKNQTTRKILLYFLSKKKRLIKDIIEISPFIEPLLTVLTITNEPGKIALDSYFKVLLKRRIIDDFKNLKGSKVDEIGGDGEVEKIRVSNVDKLNLIINFFHGHFTLELIQFLRGKINESLDEFNLLDKSELLKLVGKCNKHINFNYRALIKKYSVLTGIQDIDDFITIKDIYPRAYSNYIKNNKTSLISQIRQVLEKIDKEYVEDLEEHDIRWLIRIVEEAGCEFEVPTDEILNNLDEWWLDAFFEKYSYEEG